GFQYAPCGDLDAARQLVDDQTCAIMIEPIQGEGGIRIHPDGFLAELRSICDENEMLLVFDEVQTGCGRTGEWFGYQHFEVTPDIITLAKALCGGIAGGALLASDDVSPSLRPGMHAATFGGNPIAAAAGIATLETIEQDDLLAEARQLGEFFENRLLALQEEIGLIKEVRVCGVMVGAELMIDGGAIVADCLEHGLLVNCTQGSVIRLLPAMNLGLDAAEEGFEILANALRSATQSIDNDN
ncbi:MAG: aminotransferase class III-fold pyridoxal phosphate-dependent enzyme, partial [Pirellulaceae bacterium]